MEIGGNERKSRPAHSWNHSAGRRQESRDETEIMPGQPIGDIMAQSERKRRRAGSYREVRPGAWKVRASKGRRADGGRRTVSRTVEGSELDAKTEAARLVAELRGAAKLGESLTLEQFYWGGVFRKSDSNRGKPRSAATLRQHDSQMVRNGLPAIGHITLSKLTHGDVKATVLASTAPALTERTLRAVLPSAYEDELIDERPFRRRITTPQRRKPLRARRTAQEEIAALGAMRGRPLETYLIIGLSGLRMDESLGISPADIVPQATYDLATDTEVRPATLVVRRKYTDADGLVDEAKNEASVREQSVVAGHDRLLAIVAATRPDPGDPAAVDAWRRSRLMPLHGDTLYKRWKAELAALGLRFIPPDMLRHTSETLMQAAGLPDSVTSRFHGHAELKTDCGNYIRPGAATMEDAARKVHRLLSGEDPCGA